jgi:hypothetical protein
MPKLGWVLLAFENLLSNPDIELFFSGFYFIAPIIEDDFFTGLFLEVLKNESFKALNYLYVLDKGDWI